MIHSISMANWKRHHEKTFFFSDGLNIIKGENEAGKSLIFEAIDFALHGSVALRLAVSAYPKNLTSILEFSIQDRKYKIHRTLKKAEMFLEDQLIASGTKAVDAEVRKTFGYSRNVFLVANYSSQDAISYLSKMKPMERKNTIDNVVGLSAVEQLITECKAELTIRNRILAEHKKTEPVCLLEKPEGEYNPFWADEIDQLSNKIQLLKTEKNRLDSLIYQHISLDETYPYMDAVSEEDQGVEIVGLTQEMINKHNQDFAILNSEIKRLDLEVKQLLSKQIPEPIKPSTDRIIEGLTVQQAIDGHNERAKIVTQLQTYEQLLSLTPKLESLPNHTDAEIEAVRKQTNLYQDWLKAEKIKQTGTIGCPQCKHQFFLEHNQLLTYYSHVPDVVQKPSLDLNKMIQEKNHYESIVEQRKNTEKLLHDTQSQLADFDQQWYSTTALALHIEQTNNLKKYQEKDKPEYEAYIKKWVETDSAFKEAKNKMGDLIANWYTSDQIEKHQKAIAYKKQLELYQAGLNQWKKSKEALPDFDKLKIDFEKISKEIEELEKNLESLKVKNQLWLDYLKEQHNHDSWYDKFVSLDLEASQEADKIKTLQLFKAKIKSAILPSVNKVASTWIKKMSLESHYSVTLTDDMDILVDDEPIEALSISGRALGHLSLRMALGQVLTNSVFPVFMADEVDASMRNNRSQVVLDSLVDMLKGSVKQLIVISHRDVDAMCNLIEV